jgi:hypothetical protein
MRGGQRVRPNVVCLKRLEIDRGEEDREQAIQHDHHED